MDNKPDLHRVIQMAWPAVFESFFVSLAGMIDVFMVSGMGSEAVAAVGITTQPKFLGMAPFIALNMALAAIVARRRGEQDRKGANEALSEALLLILIIGTLISLFCVTQASWIMELCGSNSDTHDGAVQYFQIIMGGMLFNIISLALNAAQRGAGNTKIAMVTNTISSVVNIIGNYLLIGGHLGFPALGIRGAALATVFGTVVACFISIVSLFRKESFLDIRYILRKRLWRGFQSIGILLKLASGTFVEQVLMRIGFMSTAIMAADMGTSAMAAHQVGMNFLSLAFSLGDGMQAAAIALIGQSLGEHRKDQANGYGRLCQKAGVVLATAMCLFTFLFGKTLFGMFFEEKHIVEIGVGISRCIMIIVLFQVPQVVTTGCLRGAGDVFYTMCSSSFSVVIVRTAISYSFCYIFGFGIYGVWFGIVADQFCRLLLGQLRYRTGKWMEIKI